MLPIWINMHVRELLVLAVSTTLMGLQFDREFVCPKRGIQRSKKSSSTKVPSAGVLDLRYHYHHVVTVLLYICIFILLSIAVSEGAAASDIEDLQEKYPFSDEAELYSIQQPPPKINSSSSTN